MCDRTVECSRSAYDGLLHNNDDDEEDVKRERERLNEWGTFAYR